MIIVDANLPPNHDAKSLAGKAQNSTKKNSPRLGESSGLV
jgi:hypothetical protein